MLIAPIIVAQIIAYALVIGPVMEMTACITTNADAINEAINSGQCFQADLQDCSVATQLCPSILHAEKNIALLYTLNPVWMIFICVVSWSTRLRLVAGV